jgi:hypothetical protein
MVDPSKFEVTERAKRFEDLLKQTKFFSQFVEGHGSSTGNNNSENVPPVDVDVNQK